MSLLDDLRAEGLTVETWPGWETHAASTRDFEPIGWLAHWDAVKGWNLNTYFMNPRFDAPTYHVAIEKDGHVWLGSQGYVYGAGGGDPKVYEAMRNDRVPPAPTVETGMNGNPYLWAVCINYWPDGGAIPGPQYESLVKVAAAFCRRSSWNPLYRVNDHAGWTTRKADLSGRWSIPAPSNWDLTRFRNDVRRQLEGSVPVPDYAKPAVAKAVAGGFLKEGTEEQLIPRYDLMVWLDRLGALDDFRVDESGEVAAAHAQLSDLRKRIDALSVKGLPKEEVVRIVRDT